MMPMSDSRFDILKNADVDTFGPVVSFISCLTDQTADFSVGDWF